jgi:succinyl-CoA synthetase beta subunit
MNIHEYQAKVLLRKFGVPVSDGVVGLTAQEAEKGIQTMPGPLYVVKAQIHAGGRGKAGGVKLAKSKEEAIKLSKEMFGKILVTPQTGPEGKQVHRVYIENGSNIEKEYYISLVVDRATSRVTFMASTEGGVEIEEVAHSHPEKIITVSVDTAAGLQAHHLRSLGFGLKLEGDLLKKFYGFAKALYEAFIGCDCSQLEINPLIVNDKGEWLALDAKINVDDNALYRHPGIFEMRDKDEEDPLEVRAADAGLSYIKMDGSIGCMVNGAGLAMATMDIIQLYGEAPANFLDVGGGATKERVTEAFKIILSDPNVKAILVNIFGGIMRCDVIAEGIISAAKELKLTVPLIVRLEGTNVEKGKEILSKSGLAITSADNLGDAAEKVTKAVKKAA